jgi:F0F1-type ATP synthase assembly protein I
MRPKSDRTQQKHQLGYLIVLGPIVGVLFGLLTNHVPRGIALGLFVGTMCYVIFNKNKY